MQIHLAEHAGFCSGVKRAIDTALHESSRGSNVLTLGPLVHNEAVALYLARHNIAAVENPEDLASGLLLIRTHGIAPKALKKIQSQNHILVKDLTCPKVRRVQRLAQKLAESGMQIIIYGDSRHPEVKGVVGWAGDEAEIEIISTMKELRKLMIRPSAALIAQTTGQSTIYHEIQAEFLRRCPGGKVYDTLCPETGKRQEEAVRLARTVEAMVVVGSTASANTRALAETCRRLKPTLMVAGAEGLDFDFLRGCRTIGVTAGASTPPWMIKEVVERMENEKLETDVGEKVGLVETTTEETGLDETGPGGAASEEAATKEIVSGGAVREEEEAASEDKTTSEEDLSAESEQAFSESVQEEAAEKDETPSEADTAADSGEEEAADPEKSLAKAEEEAFDFIEELNLVQVGEQITGKVVRAAEDEVYLDIRYKTEALLPAKEVHLSEGETLTDRFELGQEIEVTVIDIEDRDSKVVVSRKRLARDEKWRELLEALEEKATIEGRVKQVVNAGMVLDLGEGIDGFMPGSLVDLRYIPDFKPFLGEEVKFKIIELNREKDKVILSRKKVIEEENLRKKEETLQSLEIGSTIPGVVRRLTDFGAFVDIGGIDGLVHISEIAWERVGHPQEVLKVGQDIEVKVLDVIPERERISLSLRRTQPDPWTKAMQELTDGEIVSGKITRLVNFGAFVELRPGVEGLVHISQIADYHVKHPSEVLHEGEMVDVKILELKPARKRISLSIKEVPQDNHPQAKSAEEPDTESSGTVTLGDVFGDLFENAGAGDSGAASSDEGTEK